MPRASARPRMQRAPAQRDADGQRGTASSRSARTTTSDTVRGAREERADAEAPARDRDAAARSARASGARRAPPACAAEGEQQRKRGSPPGAARGSDPGRAPKRERCAQRQQRAAAPLRPARALRTACQRPEQQPRRPAPRAARRGRIRRATRSASSRLAVRRDQAARPRTRRRLRPARASRRASRPPRCPASVRGRLRRAAPDEAPAGRAFLDAPEWIRRSHPALNLVGEAEKPSAIGLKAGRDAMRFARVPEPTETVSAREFSCLEQQRRRRSSE